MSNLRLGGERPHGDIAEVVRIPHHHMDQEVVGSCHVIEGDNLRELLGVLAKTSYLRGLVPVQPNRNHRLQPNTDHGGINISVESAEHTCRLQPADPLRACRLSDTDPTGNLLV